jgi:hypothetical protein
MGLSHISSDSLSDFIARELNINELSGSDIDKSVSWPLKEPINRGVVNDGWELSCSDSEQVSYWGEAKTEMEVLSNFVEEEFE